MASVRAHEPGVNGAEAPPELTERLNGFVDRARHAARAFRELGQDEVDRIVWAMVTAGLKNAVELAELAMQETGFGVFEATGVVAAAPGGEFEEGQQVAAMMGGMGRTFDGGYAEYTSVPATQVIPFRSELDWATLGAIPEMLQTAHGSLTVGLDAQPGQTLLIRGGTSSVGMAAAILAKDRGLTVLSTTRQPERAAALKAIGVDHVLVDDGDVAAQAQAIVPGGVEAALELVGTNTLPDTLRATAVHGVVCFTGMLSNQWTVADFNPIDYLPTGVRLTAYGGDAADLPTDVLQAYLDAVAAGRLTVPIHRTYTLDEIGQAHADMEHGSATGKLVVLP